MQADNNAAADPAPAKFSAARRLNTEVTILSISFVQIQDV
ncbi:hypothetical protein RA11412_0339 [Rothia aeria]|uniref:Uncharacterized protein n=1 Tax=Rothia aeria TaxID=172042 RepID=A0A2Z5QW60_9MICC|nr:hypothetical protein RA11412_0339 [Rothia aeria]